MIKRLYILLLLTLTSSICVAQHHVAMFYNVENLFDTINCPTAADEDMLPLSDRRWNSERYNRKLSSISQVIQDISTQHTHPALIALAEVENRTVLEDLIAQPALANAGYAICHYDSPDERGIDVALLYRPDAFHLEGSRSIRHTAENPTRDILTAWGTLADEQIFTAIVHWPSRIGGVEFTEPQRIACAEQLRHIVDSIQQHQPATKILIMGDMNDNPHNKSIAKVLGAKHKLKNISPRDLYAPFAHTKPGSSVYDGRWNHYDNIIVSANMLPLIKSNPRAGLYLKPIHRRELGAIFSRDYMLDNHRNPKPTYKGTEYIGGVSDHLPIYIILGE